MKLLPTSAASRLVGGFGLLYLTLVICLPGLPLFGHDSFIGLLIADASLKHHTFNQLFFPAYSDLTRTESVFVTWWTPGQYLFQLLGKLIANISYESSTKAVLVASLTTGLAGLARLLRLLQFDDCIVTWSLAVSGIPPLLAGMLFEYSGGDLLIWAYAPWYLALSLAGPVGFLGGVILLLAAALGFFLKAAFVPLAAVGFVVFALRGNSWAGRHLPAAIPPRQASLGATIGTCALLGLPFLVAIKVLFISHGPGIQSGSSGLALAPRAVLFPLVAPWLSLAGPDLLHTTATWLLSALPAILLYWAVARGNSPMRYRLVAAVVVGSYLCFFAGLYALGLDISYEVRHFRIPGLLLVPGLVGLVVRLTPGIRRAAVYGLAALAVLGGIRTWANYSPALTIGVPDRPAAGLLGRFSTESIAFLASQDRAEDTVIFLHPALEYLALAIRRADYFLLGDFVSYRFNNQQHTIDRLAGKRATMLLLVPRRYDRAKDEQGLFRRFTSVSQWRLLHETPDVSFYRAETAPSNTGEP